MPETPATDKRARDVRAPPAAHDGVALASTLIEAALAAQRAGTLDELVRQRPRAARWLMRRFQPLLVGTVGDALEVEQPLVLAADLLLRWALTQLRPDREPSFEGIDRKAWLDLSAWRPMLAATCYAGLLAVPEFRERYRRRTDEPAIENLCGLWSVGPSTFYRHLDRAKRTMAELLVREPIGVPMRFALRRWLQNEIARRQGLDRPDAARVVASAPGRACAATARRRIRALAPPRGRRRARLHPCAAARCLAVGQPSRDRRAGRAACGRCAERARSGRGRARARRAGAHAQHGRSHAAGLRAGAADRGGGARQAADGHRLRRARRVSRDARCRPRVRLLRRQRRMPAAGRPAAIGPCGDRGLPDHA